MKLTFAYWSETFWLWSQNCIFEEYDFLVSSLCSISIESAGENCMTKFIGKVGQKCQQCWTVALVFCAKLYRKRAVSRTLFFVPSRELISRSDSWKEPKFRTITHHYLLCKTVLGVLDIRSPSEFFLMAFLQKIAKFCKHEVLHVLAIYRAITWKLKKIKKKKPAPFVDPAFLFASQILKLVYDVLRFFLVLRNSLRDIFLFHTLLGLHIK